LQSFAETSAEHRMHLMLSLLCQPGFQLSIEPVNVGCLKLLQPLRAERGDHMDAHELFISFNGASACPFLFATRGTNRQPVLSPFSKRYSAWLDVRSIVTGLEQFAELLPGLRKSAGECHSIALLADSVAQPECIFAALVNAAITV
jgi:hypothetical protein